jgi:Secretion system C-terminal sorting domain
MKKNILFLLFAVFLARANAQTPIYYIEEVNPVVSGNMLTFDVRIVASSSDFQLLSGNIRYNFNNTSMSTTVVPTFNVTGSNLQFDAASFVGTAPNRYVNLGFSNTNGPGGVTITSAGITIGNVSHTISPSAPPGSLAGIKTRAFNVPGYNNSLPAATAANCTRIFTVASPTIPVQAGAPVNGAENTQVAAPLPVELEGIEAIAKPTNNLIKWSTAAEINSQYHIVERSAKGTGDWQEIGRKNAAGTSTKRQNYDLTDDHPLPLCYYRLKMLDIDGTFEYSEVVSVKRSFDDFTISRVFPIPAVEQVNFELVQNEAASLTITVNDMVGRTLEIKEMDVPKGVSNLKLDISGYSSGTYIVTIDNGIRKLIEQIVKQ